MPTKNQTGIVTWDTMMHHRLQQVWRKLRTDVALQDMLTNPATVKGVLDRVRTIPMLPRERNILIAEIEKMAQHASLRWNPRREFDRTGNEIRAYFRTHGERDLRNWLVTAYRTRPDRLSEFVDNPNGLALFARAMGKDGRTIERAVVEASRMIRVPSPPSVQTERYLQMIVGPTDPQGVPAWAHAGHTLKNIDVPVVRPLGDEERKRPEPKPDSEGRYIHRNERLEDRQTRIMDEVRTTSHKMRQTVRNYNLAHLSGEIYEKKIMRDRAWEKGPRSQPLSPTQWFKLNYFGDGTMTYTVRPEFRTMAGEELTEQEMGWVKKKVNTLYTRYKDREARERLVFTFGRYKPQKAKYGRPAFAGLPVEALKDPRYADYATFLEANWERILEIGKSQKHYHAVRRIGQLLEHPTVKRNIADYTEIQDRASPADLSPHSDRMVYLYYRTRDYSEGATLWYNMPTRRRGHTRLRRAYWAEEMGLGAGWHQIPMTGTDFDRSMTWRDRESRSGFAVSDAWRRRPFQKEEVGDALGAPGGSGWKPDRPMREDVKTATYPVAEPWWERQSDGTMELITHLPVLNPYYGETSQESDTLRRMHERRIRPYDPEGAKARRLSEITATIYKGFDRSEARSWWHPDMGTKGYWQIVEYMKKQNEDWMAMYDRLLKIENHAAALNWQPYDTRFDEGTMQIIRSKHTRLERRKMALGEGKMYEYDTLDDSVGHPTIRSEALEYEAEDPNTTLGSEKVRKSPWALYHRITNAQTRDELLEIHEWVEGSEGPSWQGLAISDYGSLNTAFKKKWNSLAGE